jgi:hypothetical protein
MRRATLAVVALLGLLLCVFPLLYSTRPAAQAGQEKIQSKEITVWVNTSSGVYHCPGTRWYGNTKHGKYASECAAIKDGNRPAYGKACGSDCPSAQAATPNSPPPANENTRTQQTGNPDVKVWVNTNSGVYHCSGTRWYGNTKQGEFMSQKKAQDAGNRPAYGKVCQ